MYTFIFLLGFIGVFFLYNTSKKAKLSTSGNMESWLQGHPQPATYMGIMCMVMTGVLLVLIDGLGVGVIKAFLLLMLAASAIVALTPLHLLRLKHVFLIVLLSFFLELLML